jgi:hypothetical protein
LPEQAARANAVASTAAYEIERRERGLVIMENIAN